MVCTFCLPLTLASTLLLVSCGGGGSSTNSIGDGPEPPVNNAGAIASFPDATTFSVAEQLNPMDSSFGNITTNFNSLLGTPLESSDNLVGSSDFIGTLAFREANTGTLFSGVLTINFNHQTGTGFGAINSLSVSHTNSESRFADGNLTFVLTSLEGPSYSGQISGAISETALSPRVGLVYNISGTIQGSLVNAVVNFLPGTRTLGVLQGEVVRSTGDSSTASGLYFANF